MYKTFLNDQVIHVQLSESPVFGSNIEIPPPAAAAAAAAHLSPVGLRECICKFVQLTFSLLLSLPLLHATPKGNNLSKYTDSQHTIPSPPILSSFGSAAHPLMLYRFEVSQL